MLYDTVDVAGEGFEAQFMDILNLMEQICVSIDDDEIVRLAIQIFTAVVESTEKMKAHVKERYQHFLQTCVVSRLVPSEAEMQEWITSPKVYQYEDNSSKQAAEDCMEIVSNRLGKQMVLPLLTQMIKEATNSQKWEIQDAAVNALGSAGKGISAVCKQKDAKMFSDFLSRMLQSQYDRVRFDALAVLCILSTEMAPQLQKYHKDIIAILCRMNNDQNTKVATQASTAMINYCSGLDYDQTYEHIQDIYGMIKQCWAGQMM